MSRNLKYPPFLKPGDKLAITAPARAVSVDEVADAVHWLEQKGYRVQLGKTIGTRWHQFSGTDEERAQDLQDLVGDKEVRAIFCARGGYGSTRILERINWKPLPEHPKWLVGFSDITALHAHLLSMNIVSLHGEMPVRFRATGPEFKSWEHMIATLQGKAPPVFWESKGQVLHDVIQAPVYGGNLSVLYSLLGSTSFPKTKGCILFLEDLDEYLYHVDRMVLALKRAGAFRNIKALLIGGMSQMRDNTIPFGFEPESIIRQQLQEFPFPVLFGLPVGHTALNLALVQGGTYRLKTKGSGIQLQWVG